MVSRVWCLLFCTDRAPTELYTLSLHDALPISVPAKAGPSFMRDLPGETPSSARRESEVSEGSAPAAISAPYAGADPDGLRVDYQRPAVTAGMDFTRGTDRDGVIRIFTGGGKTKTGAVLVKEWLREHPDDV